MIQFKDFVPQMITEPKLFKAGEYESFDDALSAANDWISEGGINVISVETVVLLNIWSRFEEGPTDVALGTSGEMPSHWHQFIRCWYRSD